MDSNQDNIINKIYDLRHKFIIIGLTGRTGSGCTTVASLLSNNSFDSLKAPMPSSSLTELKNEDRKYKILYTYLSNIWRKEKIKFVSIKASDIIFYFVLLDGYDKFIEFIKHPHIDKKSSNDNGVYDQIFTLLKDKFEKSIKENFIELSKKIKIIDDALNNNAILDENFHKEVKSWNCFCNKEEFCIYDGISDVLLKQINKLRVDIDSIYRNITHSKLSDIYQAWGNNIRKFGKPCVNEKDVPEQNPAKLAQKIDQIIDLFKQLKNDIYEKLDKKYKESTLLTEDGQNIRNLKSELLRTFITIDALRNPYEVLYFREKYSSFYLMSITTDIKERNNNLLSKANYQETEVKKLDELEYPEHSKDIEDSYYQQDIQKCIELSDIHIYHNNTETDRNFGLKIQLVRYLALMLHPGLVQPTPEERLMQIANVAKLNSGCLSRQVGAAITDEHFSLRAIGWNTVPQGQVPCSLRNIEDLHLRNDIVAYSEYENTDSEFREYTDTLYKGYESCNCDFNNIKSEYGLTIPYCFKDVYRGIKKENNQVHTRSLHAEENAFLQLAKYGSVGIQGGKLFTTASPCELCSKKAYQLGIKDIYYIDIYPGISFTHILNCGTNIPKLHAFQGAIGQAYEKLYNPYLSQKDEIEYLTKVVVKTDGRTNENKSEHEGSNSNDWEEKYTLDEAKSLELLQDSIEPKTEELETMSPDSQE